MRFLKIGLSEASLALRLPSSVCKPEHQSFHQDCHPLSVTIGAMTGDSMIGSVSQSCPGAAYALKGTSVSVLRERPSLLLGAGRTSYLSIPART